MTLPHQTGATRPAPPPLRLPLPRRRPGGLIASLLFHGIILLLIARFGVQWVLGGGDDRFGPRGGGGGAGGSVHLVDLPASAPPAPAAPVQQPAVHVPPPQPDPALTLTPPPVKPLSLTVAPVVAAVGTANDGTAGQGPGTGGGIGGGAGTGVGNDSGPGSGGNGAYITPPSPRAVLLPADCLRGQVTVLFSVAADGHVTDVRLDPEPQNR
ncbi:MAG TPA: hypothetical protein VFI79_10110, partial [Gemmatimonadales bacterium]|nr:hypothetical protein [Gemmatimonadales bacterium]